MSSHSNSLPPILRLPPEIRLMIYRLLLLSDRTLRMVWLQNNESIPRPNCLFPAILCTCRLIYIEAAGVLYGENVFRAHRINDTNDNAASIMRAKYLIGKVNPEDGEGDAYKLQSFLENHPNLEHLVLEFGFGLLEDSKIRDLTSYMLFRSCYSARLTISSASQSERCFYNAAQLEERVDNTAWMRKNFPEDLEKLRAHTMKKVQIAC